MARPLPVRIEAIEVLVDRSQECGPKEGFLRLSRLLVRNRYAGGSCSEPYPCDFVQRPSSEAVAAVLYQRTPDNRILVLLRRAPRAAVSLARRTGESAEPLSVVEIVAGLLEGEEARAEAGRAERAAQETLEEAGLELAPAAFQSLGAGTLASPGTSDELVHFTCAAADLAQAKGGDGDGSVMEQGAELLVLDLREAIRACRSGVIADMKTEVALLRLADALGYLPSLDLWSRDLPEDLPKRRDSLGTLSSQE